jgi:hypothetical protein
MPNKFLESLEAEPFKLSVSAGLFNPEESKLSDLKKVNLSPKEMEDFAKIMIRKGKPYSNSLPFAILAGNDISGFLQADESFVNKQQFGWTPAEAALELNRAGKYKGPKRIKTPDLKIISTLMKAGAHVPMRIGINPTNYVDNKENLFAISVLNEETQGSVGSSTYSKDFLPGHKDKPALDEMFEKRVLSLIDYPPKNYNIEFVAKSLATRYVLENNEAGLEELFYRLPTIMKIFGDEPIDRGVISSDRITEIKGRVETAVAEKEELFSIVGGDHPELLGLLDKKSGHDKRKLFAAYKEGLSAAHDAIDYIGSSSLNNGIKKELVRQAKLMIFVEVAERTFGSAEVFPGVSSEAKKSQMRDISILRAFSENSKLTVDNKSKIDCQIQVVKDQKAQAEKGVSNNTVMCGPDATNMKGFLRGVSEAISQDKPTSLSGRVGTLFGSFTSRAASRESRASSVTSSRKGSIFLPAWAQGKSQISSPSPSPTGASKKTERKSLGQNGNEKGMGV